MKVYPYGWLKTKEIKKQTRLDLLHGLNVEQNKQLSV
jgi:hypothetical protein